MKIKRSIYNLASGIIGQVITICLGLIIPRLFIVNLGSEVNGLVSSVSNIFVYFSLLETGVGLATTQALYKPIANQNREEINEILSATNKYYNRTGIVYLIGVLLIAFFYPVFANTTIDNKTIFLVVLFQGLGGVIGYFFHAKYRLLLQAEGKEYIITNLSTIVHIFVSFSKIGLILIGCDIVKIQAMYLIFNIFQTACILIYIRKKYTWLDLKVKPNFDAISQKGSVLVHQISGMIFSNTDVLILTLFCNLKVVSVYAMYNLFFTMVNTFMSTVSGSVRFQLGQIYAVDKKQFVKIFDVYSNYYSCLNFIVCTVMHIFIIPFLILYTEGVNDINYIDKILPTLFVAVNLMTNAKIPFNQAVVVAGHFKQTKWRAVIESVINLTVSIICVSQFGIKGVLIGTIVALLYRMNDYIIYANKHILNRKPFKSYMNLIIDIILMALIIFVSNSLNIVYDSYLKIVIGAGIHLIICLVLFFGANSLADIRSFKTVVNYICNKIRTKI